MSVPLWLAHKREWDRLERLKARILLEVGADLPEGVSPGSAAGDASQLRGIPVVGVRGGMGGAIRGTRPDLDAR